VRRALILVVGRLKEPLFRQACDDYYGRCARTLTVEEHELRDLEALKAALPGRSTTVLLDERGVQLGSRAFAQRLQAWMASETTQVVFIIGGADGVDDELRGRVDLVLALGKMTFAHRLARLMLAEQLYRAVSIIEGTPYHRD
jgi:23S rRNA (pseudouridine1915-N3)-methyltransferase